MSSVTKWILFILNTASFLLGFSISVYSMWFFVQIHDVTSLRNKNHYLLDYNVYWPQVIPWIFFIVAVFVLSVSCLGCTSIRKNSRNLIIFYVICLGIVIVCLITTTVIALVLANDESIDKFVKDIIWDVFSQMKTDDEAAEGFKDIERELHCCGASSPRDYKSWKNEFPMSCCDGYNYGWLEPYVTNCEFSNKLANERHGCAAVATQYAAIAVKVLSGVSIFTAVIVCISLGVSVVHYSEF